MEVLEFKNPNEGLLTRKAFADGMIMIVTIFPSLNTSQKLDVWFGLLKDLTVEQFQKGVDGVLKNQPEIWPETNIVAHIRAHALKK